MKTKALIKKLHPNVNIPEYKTSGSSGLDLEAFIQNDLIIKPKETVLVPTGLSVAIEDHLEIQIRPRSGLAAKNKITVLNTPGTIDSDYRGEIKIILINLGDNDLKLNDILIDSRTAEDMWGDTDTIFGIENAYGTSGDDAIFGSDNNNEIYAGSGDDIIYGGSGDDVLDGGDGNDMFVFLQSDLEANNNDIDIINNFNINEDKISFDTLGMNDVQIDLIDNEGGTDAVLTFNDQADWGSIILVDVGRLDTDDIIIDSGVSVG